MKKLIIFKKLNKNVMNIIDEIGESSGILFLKENHIDVFLEKINNISDVKK